MSSLNLTAALLIVLGFTSAASVANAATVNFSTTGSLTGLSSTTALTFAGADPFPYGLPAAQVSLGTFSFNGPVESLTNATFSLTVTQTSPSNGTGTFMSKAFSGKLQSASPTGGLFLVFANTSITLGGITYKLDNLNANSLDSTDHTRDLLQIGIGDTDITADITGTTPEPSFYLATGLGLASLFFALRRKVKGSSLV